MMAMMSDLLNKIQNFKLKNKSCWYLLIVSLLFVSILLSKVQFKQKMNLPSEKVAHPINFNGKGVYGLENELFDFGVIFEDDGETGYFYATNKDHTEVFDALHLMIMEVQINLLLVSLWLLYITILLKRLAYFIMTNFMQFLTLKMKKLQIDMGFQ